MDTHGTQANNAWREEMELASVKRRRHVEGTKAKRVNLSPSWWYVDRLAVASQSSGIITIKYNLVFIILSSNVTVQATTHGLYSVV